MKVLMYLIINSRTTLLHCARYVDVAVKLNAKDDRMYEVTENS